MKSACAECDCLWEEYSQAAAAHVKVVIEHHKAVIQRASGVIDEIARLEYELAERELKARRAIRDHEAEHEQL